ncbi:hypothetical protein BG011_007052 [Mortierella polycephala]|uniref:Uncharacterized protein n=1 Tax=Mortierella polycephala TaxID=41804 RepID=A0A9P6QBR3_9FUNG|nr:hypothetical protein BG011_007052 [Mortierella polycephala]
MDMETTAVIKSWYEVVRLTDPLIWSLATESTPNADNHDVLLPQGNLSFPHHPYLHHYLHQYQHQNNQKQQQQQLLASTKESSALLSYQACVDSCCRSLLDPRPRNSLDWLKCHDAAMNTKEMSIRNQRRKDIRMDLSLPIDLELAGEATSTDHNSGLGIQLHTRNAPEAVPQQSTGMRPHLDSIPTLNPFHSYSGSRGEGIDQCTMSTGAATPAQISISSTPAHPPMAIASVSVATVATAAVVAHSNAETETGSASPLAVEQPTAVTAQGVKKTPAGGGRPGPGSPPNEAASLSPSASSNSPRPVVSLTSVPSSSDGSDTDVNNGINTKTTITPTTVAESSSFIPSPAVIDSAIEMTQRGLIQSKDATTAFLYRTFSPTYRVCRLYVESWTNGSQLRGLERIKTSVVRRDAFTLVSNASAQMKDVWQQVMAAYRAKAAETRTSVTSSSSTSLSTTAENDAPDTEQNHGQDKHSGKGDKTQR